MMTVKELKQAIADLPDDMRVFGYWDTLYWHVSSCSVEDHIEDHGRIHEPLDSTAFVLNVSGE